uniref:7TM_GPCR_Srx domain-containing protein n=1 Tax=Elaeophora elaphi TaxID=1147741 RepID=A0A0R3RSW0_9BILA
MLTYALASNILILIGIARNNSMRCSTRYFLGAVIIISINYFNNYFTTPLNLIDS